MMKICTTPGQLGTAGMLMALIGGAAAQQAYPNKPIRVIGPYALVGSVSILARLVGRKASENWGQQVIVDIRPTANIIIGIEA